MIKKNKPKKSKNALTKPKKHVKKKALPSGKAKKTTLSCEKHFASRSFPIVAIGASAGGLEAFEKFFTHLPKAVTGMAYVIITHLDREHVSILPELIKKYTSLPVVAIKDGIAVKKDTIYVIPPKMNIGIKHGVLTLVEQVEPHYKNLPINLFFRSLAEDRGENAIAIVLSGTGSDGTLGLQDIKEYGGLSIVQDPATAAFDSMPRSAINTGLVDYVMEVEDIPQQLKKYLDYGKITEGKISAELQQILMILRNHTGHDFSHYKLNTVCRRIEKQMYGHHIKTLAQYVRFLRTNLNEVDNLLKDLLIGVTRFFRDITAFETLKYKVLPLLLKNKPKNYSLRVWIPACSTGQEAYSIAILLQECMDELGKDFNIQIFATDIDLNALEVARSGIYPESIAIDVSPERLKRFFTKEQSHYKIKSEIRSKVIFGEQNIIKDPPFTKLDLICCRNLLIYLDAKLQKKILPIFHYSLKPKGILFLGMSEATSGFNEYFELIAKKCKIFVRKDVASTPRALLGFDTMPSVHETAVLPYIEPKVSLSKKYSINDKLISAIQTFILDHYTSPCIVINQKGDIFYMHGSNKNYLKVTNKKINLNISEHVYPEIKMALLPGMHKMLTSKKEISYKNLKIKVANKIVQINLHILPFTHVDALRGFFLVIFEDVRKGKIVESTHAKSSLLKSNQKLEEIVQELQYTKENLQATIEELEAGNEELQSANEELQSTNEEIETSKEELQSLNEELIVVNTELQSMIDQLATVNDDMNNLFNSTEIAAFFLDNDLKIKRFTPKAQEFMHLIQADVGRSFSHFASMLKSEKLIENAEEVLKTLHKINYDVEGKNNRWYHIQILPYRTLSNVIDGVVITLSDITVFKDYENTLLKLNNELRNSLAYAENIVNTVHEPLLILDANLKVMSANDAFYKTFKLTVNNSKGRYIYELGDGQFDIPQLKKLLDKVISKNQVFKDYHLTYHFKKVGERSFVLNARKVNHLNASDEMILLALRSI